MNDEVVLYTSHRKVNEDGSVLLPNITALEQRVKELEANLFATTATVASLEAKLAEAERERDQWKKALHGLTPGGSEYADDPVACVEWVRKSREDQHYAILSFKTQRDRLREVLQTILTTHCAYPDLPTPYQIGVTDGHRCAANMAREALKEG